GGIANTPPSPRKKKTASHQVEDLVATVAEDQMVWRHLQPVGQRPLQVVAPAIRVSMTIWKRLSQSAHRLGRWAQGVLVRGELHGPLDSKLLLHLLHRFTREERNKPLEKRRGQ